MVSSRVVDHFLVSSNSVCSRPQNDSITECRSNLLRCQTIPEDRAGADSHRRTRGELCAVIGVQDSAVAAYAFPHSHVDGVVYQSGVRDHRERTRDNHFAEPVKDGAAVHLAIAGRVLGVGSDQGAVSAFLLARFPGPPSEPDVPVSEHPALHVFMPMVWLPLWSSCLPMVWGSSCPGIGSG